MDFYLRLATVARDVPGPNIVCVEGREDLRKVVRVDRGEISREPIQRGVDQRADGPQRMIVRHQVVRAHIVEQLGSLSIRSTHPLGTLLPTGAANRIAAASGKGFFRILLVHERCGAVVAGRSSGPGAFDPFGAHFKERWQAKFGQIDKWNSA